MFESELGKSYDCVMEMSTEVGIMTEYKLRPHGNRSYHTVKCDLANGTMSCSCKKFEFAGILCSHILKVLSSKNIMKIPSQYILKIWTKNAKMGSCVFPMFKDNTTSEDSKANMASRYKELCRLQTQIATRGSETKEAYDIVSLGFTKILEELDANIRGQNILPTISTSMTKCNEKNNIDGVGKITGIKRETGVRGSSARLKSALEKCKKRKRRVKPQQVSINPGTNEQFNYEAPTLCVNINAPDNMSQFTSMFNHDQKLWLMLGVSQARQVSLNY